MSRDGRLRRLSLVELRDALAALEPEELGLVLPADWITRGVLALSPEGRDSCLGEIVDAIEEAQEELPGLLQVRLFLANGLVGSLRRALAASREDVRVLEGEVLEAQLARQEEALAVRSAGRLILDPPPPPGGFQINWSGSK